ncbi:hypothetical protein IQ249_04285 [Lusitaniella coriacea LEGE 07157]|uniref:Uncharacterized protein n=1 Tax=Lusitaniella coriacea LEGE 07157 TaxID=945747 RepID=A0A8J7ANR6_9CYAN|nr:hypothetical protein [Lusitaniella coriacea]MBE9115113.1 hypothetical protein [Lusitaniella coriacea LEGE 07157]
MNIVATFAVDSTTMNPRLKTKITDDEVFNWDRSNMEKFAYDALEAINRGKPELALELAMKIEDEVIRDRALATIAPYLNTSQQYDRILHLLPSFEYKLFQSYTLKSIKPKLQTKEQIEAALQIVQSFAEQPSKDVWLDELQKKLEAYKQEDSNTAQQ